MGVTNDVGLITAVIIFLISLLFSVIMLLKFYKIKKNQFLYLGLCFLFFGLGWIFTSLAHIFLLIEEIVYFEAFFISFAPVFLFFLFFNFAFPVFEKYSYFLGIVLIIPFLVSVFSNPPIISNEGIIEYSTIQTMLAGIPAIMAFFCALMFINYYFNKEFNKTIKRKSLFYGLGILMMVIATFAGILTYDFLFSIIFRIFIILGLTVLYFGGIL